MNDRFFKKSMFLAVAIGLSITLLLLEFEKNNNFLLAQEQERSIKYINNKNLQSSLTVNSHINNFKKSISIDEVNDIRTIKNQNGYMSELTIHIPTIFSSCN